MSELNLNEKNIKTVCRVCLKKDAEEMCCIDDELEYREGSECKRKPIHNLLKEFSTSRVRQFANDYLLIIVFVVDFRLNGLKKKQHSHH